MMIQEFTTYLTNIKGYSHHTATAYEKDIRRFATWAKTNVRNARWSTITLDDIDSYVKARVEQGKAPATTNRELASIASFYNYLRRSGHDVTNPCRYESRRKGNKTLPNIIPERDLQKAYEQTTGSVKLMIGLLATTGMRISELLSLNWTDIDFSTGAINVLGKGSKERVVYTSHGIIEIMRLAQKHLPGTYKVFSVGDRVARHWLWRALKDVSAAPQLSPHAIRHSYATRLAQSGVNAPTLAKILGHTRIETSQHYIDSSRIDVQSACNNNHIIN